MCNTMCKGEREVTMVLPANKSDHILPVIHREKDNVWSCLKVTKGQKDL